MRAQLKTHLPRGFTLLEVMVVLAIIGLMIAAIGINLTRDNDRLARLEAKRFMAVVNEVRDEAIISGESFFLRVDKRANSYSFAGVRAAQASLQDDGLLRARQMASGVRIDWEVLEQFNQSEEDEDNELTEQVLITPLGEITPFDAWFQGDENKHHVFINDEYQLQQKVEDGRL